MKKYLRFIILTLLTMTWARATPPPEKQVQEFVFSLHDKGDVGEALQGLLKDSPAFASHPERIQETVTAVTGVVKEFGPIQFTRFVRKEDIAPILMRLFLVSETTKGPVFWCATFYRSDPKVEAWSVVSIRAAATPDEFIR